MAVVMARTSRCGHLRIPVIGVVFSSMLQLNGIVNEVLRAGRLGRLALDWIGNARLTLWTVMGVIIVLPPSTPGLTTLTVVNTHWVRHAAGQHSHAHPLPGRPALLCPRPGGGCTEGLNVLTTGMASGRRAVWLENDELRVMALPGKGADIAGFIRGQRLVLGGGFIEAGCRRAWRRQTTAPVRRGKRPGSDSWRACYSSRRFGSAAQAPCSGRAPGSATCAAPSCTPRSS